MLHRETEVEALRWHKERVEKMEHYRDAVLEHYTALAPEALDSLTPEGRHQLYKMLRLKVFVAKSGNLEAELAGVPPDGADANSSSVAEVISRVSSRTKTPPELAVTIRNHKADIMRVMREDDKIRRPGVIQSGRQVFDLAREFFGTDGRQGAA